MGPVQSSYYTDHQGMPLPIENRWPWNPSSVAVFPETRKNENQQSWSPWSSPFSSWSEARLSEVPFQETRKNENPQSWSPWSAPFSPWSEAKLSEVAFRETRKSENPQSWSPWSAPFSPWSGVAFQEKKNNENRQNSQSAAFEDFSSAAGSLGETQSKSESLVTDQSMIFKNIINENRLKNSKNFRPLKNFRPIPPITSRKINRKKKRNRRMHQITNDTTVNSFRGLGQQQGHQIWSHVPVFDWSQSNLPARSTKMNFQNSLQTGSFNTRDKNPRRYQYSKRRTITNISTNVSGSTPEKASRVNFKLSNLPNNSIMGNAASCTMLDSNKSAIKVTKLNKRNGKQLKSSSSMNFENEDDIIYLFSVDSSSEDKMFLEIDLESDGVNLSSNRNPKDDVNSTQKLKTGSATEDQSVNTVEELVSTVPVTSRKRKLRRDDIKANKRSNYMPRCTACDMNYDDVIGKSGNMYISSSCTHVFCGFCISKSGKSEVCSACNIKFLSFRRLYM